MCETVSQSTAASSSAHQSFHTDNVGVCGREVHGVSGVACDGISARLISAIPQSVRREGAAVQTHIVRHTHTLTHAMCLTRCTSSQSLGSGIKQFNISRQLQFRSAYAILHTRSLLVISFPCRSGGTVIQVLYPGSPPGIHNHILLITLRSCDNVMAVSAVTANNSHRSRSGDSISSAVAGGVPFCRDSVLISTIQIGGG